MLERKWHNEAVVHLEPVASADEQNPMLPWPFAIWIRWLTSNFSGQFQNWAVLKSSPPAPFFFGLESILIFTYIEKGCCCALAGLFHTLYAEQQFPSHGCTTITRSTRRKSFFTELTKRCSLELECTCLAHFLLFFDFSCPQILCIFYTTMCLLRKSLNVILQTLLPKYFDETCHMNVICILLSKNY